MNFNARAQSRISRKLFQLGAFAWLVLGVNAFKDSDH